MSKENKNNEKDEIDYDFLDEIGFDEILHFTDESEDQERDIEEILNQIVIKEFLCPRCGKLSKLPTALSRRDNKTKICSGCGTDEAMFEVCMYQCYDEEEKKILIEKEKKWLKNVNNN